MNKDLPDEELWGAVQDLDRDLLDPSIPTELIELAAKGMGLDSSALRAEGTALAAALLDQKRRTWMQTARQNIESMRRRARSTTDFAANAEGSASLMNNELERLAMHMFTLEMAVLENALVFLGVLDVPREDTRIVLDGGMKAIQVTTRVTGEARFCAPWDQPGWVTVHQQKWVQTGEYTFELRQEWNPC